MERQYIGARYVPKFFENPNTGDSAWLAGVAYEALTIVTFGDNSYTSKKPVPAGIGSPNANPTYWAPTGVYNAHIGELERQVSAITADLGAFEESTTANFSRIFDRKYIFISDSYGNYTNASGRNMVAEACNLLGITDYYDFHRGSAGFHRTGDLNFLQVLTDNDSVITDKTVITDIFVIGGANDQLSAATNGLINSGMANFSAYVKTNYPNASIHVGFVSKSFNLQEYFNFMRALSVYKQCGKYGMEYLTGSEMIMQYNRLFREDMVHPTPEAVDHIAYYLTQLIIAHKCSVTFGYITDLFAIDNSTISAELVPTASYTYFNDGKTALKAVQAANLLAINCTIPSMSGASYSVTGLTLKHVFAPAMVANSNVHSCVAVVRHSGGVSYIPATLSMPGNYDSAQNCRLNLFLFLSATLTDVTQIAIYGDWTMEV